MQASEKSKDIKAKKVKKEKDPINFFYMIKKIYPICFKTKPSYFIFNQSIGIFHGVSHAASVLVTQYFYDSVIGASEGTNSFHFAVIMLLCYAGIYILQNVLNAVHNFSHNVNWQRIWCNISVMIAKKSAVIDPAEYENPKRLDDISKAMNGADPAIHFMLTTSTLLTFYTPYYIFMAFYLYNMNPILILAILFAFVPAAVSQFLKSSVFSKLEDKVAPIRRENEAYANAVCDRAFLKETRILGAFGYFKRQFEDTIQNLNKANWKANLRSNIIDTAMKLMSFLGYGGVLYLLVVLLLRGEISVGSFAAVYSSIGALMYIMEEIINMHIGNISREYGLIRNLLRFLEIPVDKRENDEIDKNSDIILENVKFRYPNAEHDSLSDISLTIRNGETIAIVGENGAGKTTLVKLLTGLYKATEGSVTIDGKNVNTVEYKKLFGGISGVFQKYQRYKMTLDENIRIADFDSGEKIEQVLDKNGVEYKNTEIFPNGTDTILSREFDGTDLSGGQWQRIAIARGFYRDSNIIVLDEPTAAIDPIEESNIYKKFIDVAKDKTAIIVTHRMGSAKIAERIIVMNQGKIEQIGTHDELIQSGGLYKEMYTAQSGWYE